MATIPNLDDLGIEPLCDAAETFERLCEYANLQRRAQLCLITGKNNRAAVLEAHCEAVYASLPAWAKFREDK